MEELESHAFTILLTSTRRYRYNRNMQIQKGDCVKIPDGRIGRVRDVSANKCKVRVRRKTSKTHQFLNLAPSQLKRIKCPKGWMSPEGYKRYLRITLAKIKIRDREKKNSG